MQLATGAGASTETPSLRPAAMPQYYWNRRGRNQEAYETLILRLSTVEGTSDEPEIEFLLAIERVYSRLHLSGALVERAKLRALMETLLRAELSRCNENRRESDEGERAHHYIEIAFETVRDASFGQKLPSAIFPVLERMLDCCVMACSVLNGVAFVDAEAEVHVDCFDGINGINGAIGGSDLVSGRESGDADAASSHDSGIRDSARASDAPGRAERDTRSAFAHGGSGTQPNGVRSRSLGAGSRIRFSDTPLSSSMGTLVADVPRPQPQSSMLSPPPVSAVAPPSPATLHRNARSGSVVAIPHLVLAPTRSAKAPVQAPAATSAPTSVSTAAPQPTPRTRAINDTNVLLANAYANAPETSYLIEGGVHRRAYIIMMSMVKAHNSEALEADGIEPEFPLFHLVYNLLWMSYLSEPRLPRLATLAQNIERCRRALSKHYDERALRAIFSALDAVIAYVKMRENTELEEAALRARPANDASTLAWLRSSLEAAVTLILEEIGPRLKLPLASVAPPAVAASALVSPRRAIATSATVINFDPEIDLYASVDVEGRRRSNASAATSPRVRAPSAPIAASLAPSILSPRSSVEVARAVSPPAPQENSYFYDTGVLQSLYDEFACMPHPEDPEKNIYSIVGAAPLSPRFSLPLAPTASAAAARATEASSVRTLAEYELYNFLNSALRNIHSLPRASVEHTTREARAICEKATRGLGGTIALPKLEAAVDSFDSFRASDNAALECERKSASASASSQQRALSNHEAALRKLRAQLEEAMTELLVALRPTHPDVAQWNAERAAQRATQRTSSLFGRIFGS